MKSAGIGAGAARRLRRQTEELAWHRASACVWRLLGWDFKVGFFLGLKPAHLRPSSGWSKQGRTLRAGIATSRGYSAAGSAKGSTFCPFFSYFLRPSLHISGLIKPRFAGSSQPVQALPRQLGHSCIQVQGCPPETSWVSWTLLTVPPQASGWLRSPTRSRTCKHGVSSGC